MAEENTRGFRRAQNFTGTMWIFPVDFPLKNHQEPGEQVNTQKLKRWEIAPAPLTPDLQLMVGKRTKDVDTHHLVTINHQVI
jgi:hypothetical protein